jgi:hypothetical protein
MYASPKSEPGKDIKVPPAPSAPMVPTTATSPGGAGPSSPTHVYHYVNAATGDHVASLLPPDHPQMRCLQEGRHVTQTRYGVLGQSHVL